MSLYVIGEWSVDINKNILIDTRYRLRRKWFPPKQRRSRGTRYSRTLGGALSTNTRANNGISGRGDQWSRSATLMVLLLLYKFRPTAFCFAVLSPGTKSIARLPLLLLIGIISQKVASSVILFCINISRCVSRPFI